MTTTMSQEGLWWHSLTDECPITLELLSTLPYPPFDLDNGGITCYFDGLALASYIVSRGIFQNPLTREKLTLADCRRLDDYLELYCYPHAYQLQSSTGNRKISVAEAFGLQHLVQVKQAHPSQSRAQALQSAATAALAGLFIYGHDRSGRRESEESMSSSVNQAREDNLLLEWGFDLARRVEDSSSAYSQEGLTVIDDDEDLAVATQRVAFEATQNAFPPLNPDTSNATATHHHTPTTATIDKKLLEKIQRMTIEENQEKKILEKRLAIARQHLLNEAIKRRDNRRREKQEKQSANRISLCQEKLDMEEMNTVKIEIERWRNKQWNKLCIESESRQKSVISQEIATSATAKEFVNQEFHSQEKNERDNQALEEVERNKKAKAAAKRKRARERKKNQKAVERKRREEIEIERTRQAEKAKSKIRCERCGEGLLDAGFEKFGKLFCSTKCAGSAKPT